MRVVRNDGQKNNPKPPLKSEEKESPTINHQEFELPKMKNTVPCKATLVGG